MGLHDLSIRSYNDDDQDLEKPSEEEALEAVRTLLRWTGDNPNREGLAETPKRVLKAFDEWFKGYGEDPFKILGKTFKEVEGYNDWVTLKSIRFESHCEHHLAPIIGSAKVAYLPDGYQSWPELLKRIPSDYRFKKGLQGRLD